MMFVPDLLSAKLLVNFGVLPKDMTAIMAFAAVWRTNQNRLTAVGTFRIGVNLAPVDTVIPNGEILNRVFVRIDARIPVIIRNRLKRILNILGKVVFGNIDIRQFLSNLLRSSVIRNLDSSFKH